MKRIVLEMIAALIIMCLCGCETMPTAGSTPQFGESKNYKIWVLATQRFEPTKVIVGKYPQNGFIYTEFSIKEAAEYFAKRMKNSEVINTEIKNKALFKFYETAMRDLKIQGINKPDWLIIKNPTLFAERSEGYEIRQVDDGRDWLLTLAKP